MIDDIVCTCIANGFGRIAVIDPFCNMQASLLGVPVAVHKDMGTAQFESPYDEVAKEMLSND